MASRCGVFGKTDVQNLLSREVAHAGYRRFDPARGGPADPGNPGARHRAGAHDPVQRRPADVHPCAAGCLHRGAGLWAGATCWRRRTWSCCLPPAPRWLRTAGQRPLRLSELAALLRHAEHATACRSASPCALVCRRGRMGALGGSALAAAHRADPGARRGRGTLFSGGGFRLDDHQDGADRPAGTAGSSPITPTTAGMPSARRGRDWKSCARHSRPASSRPRSRAAWQPATARI